MTIFFRACHLAAFTNIALSSAKIAPFVHAGLSAAVRSQTFNFSPTQEADLNLPVLSLSSRFEFDGIFYSPLSADTRKALPYCVLYSDGDVEWRSALAARSEHREAQLCFAML